jgi:hypothetical protein
MAMLMMMTWIEFTTVFCVMSNGSVSSAHITRSSIMKMYASPMHKPQIAPYSTDESKYVSVQYVTF